MDEMNAYLYYVTKWKFSSFLGPKYHEKNYNSLFVCYPEVLHARTLFWG